MNIESNQDCVLQVNDIQSNNNINTNNFDFLLSKYNIDKDKYIVPAFHINFYNRDNIIGNDDVSELICPICYNILNNPKRCSSNQNSHSFCKDCIDKYLEQSDYCPMCKKYFEYMPNYDIEEFLNKLYFKCIYFKEGCLKIVKYPEYFEHINNCEYKNITYECHVEKYDYINKNFIKCCYKGNIKEIEKHFKNCALLKYKCIFCNDNILKINFREHLEDTFKISIINFGEGDKYVGQFKNGKSEGYGIDYYLNGDKYEGDFKNNLYEGYGIFYYITLDKYEGEFKNGKADGYGTFYNSNGNKYEGEFKNGIKDGFGIEYYTNGSIYEGEFYNDLKDGLGINYNKEDIYIGEYYNDLKDGLGIIYYSNGDKYKGEFKEGLREGYGIYYFSEGDIYEGEFKNDFMEGYGIINYSNGDIYKGELINGKAEGYGIILYSNGDKYEGVWRNGETEGHGIDYHADEVIYEEDIFQLHENRQISYFYLFKLYFYKVIKMDKFFFVKILSLILIVYFLVFKTYKH